MAHSFACLHYHIVFSTKGRTSLLAPAWRHRLYDYLGGILRRQQSTLMAANGTDDHVHLLASLHRDLAVSAVVRTLKSNSSRWVHEEFPELRHFAWQQGYGAFSLSYQGLDRVKAYLAQQEAHHRRVSFQEEFLSFLKAHQIPYDERYLWD
jgi:REP element-mobilizing transposase RayT